MKKVVGLCFSLFLASFSGLPLRGQSDPSQTPMANSRQTLAQEIRLVSLRAVDGTFDRVENEKLYTVVGFDPSDREKKVFEEIDLGRIRAVYLIQGKREALMKYIFGGAGFGGAGGLSSFFLKNKMRQEENPNETSAVSAEVFLWSSVGATVGAVIGYLWGRGIEDVRMMPIFDREIKTKAKNGLDYQDINNIRKIPRDHFIHVVVAPYF